MMRTILRLFLFLLIFASTILFNIGLINIRFEEIQYLLGTIATADEMSNTFGIVAKYELIKRRMVYGEENTTNYEFEAKMQALISGDAESESEVVMGEKYYRVPVRFILNGLRYILGKPIINPKEEDKIFSVLEIGYYWERNRQYNEALKIYDEVLSTAHLDPEIRAAIMVHRAFCYSMLSRYDDSKKIYEMVINAYPNTEAGIISWKLLDFITSMENEREKVKKQQLSKLDKAKQYYLLMDFRNAIKNYSIFLSKKRNAEEIAQARFYKGRSHEELGEIEEAMMEYKAVLRKDITKVWARQANRRMLMLGEFYEQQKNIADEAKRQLSAYQDQIFIKNVERYSALVSRTTLKKELAAGKNGIRDLARAANDSIMNLIDNIGNIDLASKEKVENKEVERMHTELIESGKLSKAEIAELKRRKYLAENPYRRPSALKQFIDENSRELRYLYNKRLRKGIKLSGKMVVAIRIAADGSVGSAKVLETSMGDTEFEELISHQIMNWKFKAVPDSLGSITVNYPFEFTEEF
jgi:TonB family protein